MKSNVSKFLVKSVLFTAATMIPGGINGMEQPTDQAQCLICLDPLTESVFSLQCNIGSNKINHKFHKKCIKEWIKYNIYCPICKRDLSNDELNDLLSVLGDLSPNQRRIIDRWNKGANDVYRCGGYVDSSKNEMCYPLLIRNKYTSKYGSDPAFESEDNFINAGLGLCCKCDYIFERPEICNITDVANTRARDVRQQFAQCIKKCPCCGAENINPQGVKSTTLHTYNYSPKARLFNACLLFTLSKK